MTDKPIPMLVITQQKPSEIYIWSNCNQIKMTFYVFTRNNIMGYHYLKMTIMWKEEYSI